MCRRDDCCKTVGMCAALRPGQCQCPDTGARIIAGRLRLRTSESKGSSDVLSWCVVLNVSRRRNMPASRPLLCTPCPSSIDARSSGAVGKTAQGAPEDDTMSIFGKLVSAIFGSSHAARHAGTHVLEPVGTQAGISGCARPPRLHRPRRQAHRRARAYRRQRASRCRVPNSKS